MVLSEPYTFSSLNAPGVTASAALAGGKKVLGVDLTLAGLQAFIDGQNVSPRGGILLVDSHKSIMAKTEKAIAAELKALSADLK